MWKDEAVNQQTQTIVIKLRLRDKHAAELSRQARAVNFVFNYCNETSKRAWERDRRWLSGYDLTKLCAGSSDELGLNSATIEQVCQKYALSRDRAKRASISWRSRSSLGWVPFNGRYVKFDGASLIFRKVAYQPMHLRPELVVGVRIGCGSFNQDSRGRWYANLPIEVACADRASINHVGIDLGLKDLAVLSNGERVEMPRFYRKSEAALATAQRAGKSKRARSIHAKIANRRKDFLHKASRALVDEYGLIIVGDVSPSKLAQTRMAKSVLDAGWSGFKEMLSYKSLRNGGSTIEVNERWTTRTCSECGSLPPSWPEGIASLGIRQWECSECGTVHDRDVNAARNIARAGLRTLAEGSQHNREQSNSRRAAQRPIASLPRFSAGE